MNDLSTMKISLCLVLTMYLTLMHLEKASLMNFTKSTREHILSLKKINARTLFMDMKSRRAETGRIYIQNIDYSNSHSSFLDKVNMSNLCQEITLPTTPIEHPDDEKGEIALCILSAINVGSIKLEEIPNLTELAVRGLDELIEYQRYPVKMQRYQPKQEEV